MKVSIQYDKEKDIWCLLNKGKSTNNLNFSTKQYEQLVKVFGENHSIENAGIFIEQFIIENSIDIQKTINVFESEWNKVSNEFQKRAENIFGVNLIDDVNVYLTINSRCPYSIESNIFYLSFHSISSVKSIMHELWHFYTWYGLGENEETRLGSEKYNMLKESLTVLLNIECSDLLPEGVIDLGYPQHQELRQKITEFWKDNRDIKKLWAHFAN